MMNERSQSIASPFAHPLYVMAKPVGAQCNLACKYCYYLEKSGLYPHQGSHFMTEELLESFVKQYIAAQTQREVLFTWHGGEAMLKPLSFYQKVVELQRKYADGHIVDNCLQTNGTLITEEWCAFLRDHQWLVGVSLDGPREVHDLFRKDRQGRGSFDRVMRGIGLLNRYGVEWNAMAVVNRINAQQPLGFYHFFKDIGCHYIQFTPVVERESPVLVPPIGGCHDKEEVRVTPESVQSEQWGYFLCAIFDEWVAGDVGNYYVQLFDATLANWVGVEPDVCSMARNCGNALVMEYNGDVYSCDHFVFQDYKLGNIRQQPLASLGYGERQNQFRKLKTALPSRCRRCEYEFACHGECPKNRIIPTEHLGLNYLCEGYRSFFHHVAPYMDFMAREWKADRAPANVMDAVAQGFFNR